MIDEDKAWVEYKNRFSGVYDDLNYSKGLQGFVMRSGHAFSERAYGCEARFRRVLEIGAGTGEHLPFVRHGFDEYVMIDHNSSALSVASRKLANLNKGNLRYEAHSGEKIPYPDKYFDRVVACHVLEHIYRPHLAIKEWSRLVKDGGVLTILIPTDPGLAWRLGRHFGPRRNAISMGISYDYVMAREHVNHCGGLMAILRHYFPDGEEAWWPFRVPSVDINLFAVFHAKIGS